MADHSSSLLYMLESKGETYQKTLQLITSMIGPRRVRLMDINDTILLVEPIHLSEQGTSVLWLNETCGTAQEITHPKIALEEHIQKVAHSLAAVMAGITACNTASKPFDTSMGDERYQAVVFLCGW